MGKILTYSIYTLTDNATGRVFYVGYTKCETMRRKSYAHCPSKSNNEVYSYLHQNKINFSFDVIDTITTMAVEEAKILEAHWINHYKSIGFTLLNKNTPHPKDLARQIFS